MAAWQSRRRTEPRQRERACVGVAPWRGKSGARRRRIGGGRREPSARLRGRGSGAVRWRRTSSNCAAATSPYGARASGGSRAFAGGHGTGESAGTGNGERRRRATTARDGAGEWRRRQRGAMREERGELKLFVGSWEVGEARREGSVGTKMRGRRRGEAGSPSRSGCAGRNRRVVGTVREWKMKPLERWGLGSRCGRRADTPR